VVKAGTPLAEIEARLAVQGQMLPFEPMDHRGLLGTGGESGGEPTIGGVVACGVSGPRRIQAGACRDSMLGVRFVNGRGEAIKSGGRVMKNVTGYDLPKLLCGCYGTLGVISEIGFKVLPMPKTEATLFRRGLSPARAIYALSAALTSPFGITGAAHLDGEEGPRTMVRIEGLEGSVDYRKHELYALLGAGWETANGAASAALWREVRDVAPFAGRAGAVWRVSVKPGDGPGLSENLDAAGLDHAALYDWGGGLVWLMTEERGDAGAALIRRETAARGGHATLVRANAATRAAVEVFEPEPAPLARISAGLRAKFDPAGILNPGRMG
jgi:glycolate oxidase FAD binding subunit